MMPLVSVIIPCYKQANYLPETLDSVLCQTYPNWECIIVNDGSPDNTSEVAKKYCNQDKRFRYVEQENRGLSSARNRGLDEASGRYIQFLDSDDIIDPDKIRLQIESLSMSKGLALSYTDYRHCPEDDTRKTIRRDNFAPPRFVMDRPLYDIASRWETRFSIPVHSFLFDARFFQEKGIRFDVGIPNHEDWDCWMQIFSLNPIVKLTEGPFAIYRLRQGAMCTDRDVMWRGFRKALIKQQKIFRHDPIMRRILSDKFSEMRAAYKSNRSEVWLRLALHSFARIYRRYVPWPVQKLFAVCCKSNNHKEGRQ